MLGTLQRSPVSDDLNYADDEPNLAGTAHTFSAVALPARLEAIAMAAGFRLDG